MIAIIATAIACFVVGGILSYVLFRYVLKSKYDSVLKDAETEAEVIKKNKLLEVKEKFLNKKADLEKEVALRINLNVEATVTIHLTEIGRAHV